MSTVIKAGEVAKVVGSLSTVDLADHLAEARSVVDAARNKAIEIQREADKERERLYAEARAAGLRDGHIEGCRKGEEDGRAEARREALARFQAETGDLVEDLKRAVAEFDRMKEDLRIAAEQQLLAFAMQLVEKLTFAVGSTYTESAQENLRRAIECVGAQTDLVVRVHPADMETLARFAADLKGAIEGAGHVQLIADETLAPGGCTVTTSATEVDASLPTQLAELAVLLTGRRAGPGREVIHA